MVFERTLRWIFKLSGQLTLLALDLLLQLLVVVIRCGIWLVMYVLLPGIASLAASSLRWVGRTSEGRRGGMG